MRGQARVTNLGDAVIGLEDQRIPLSIGVSLTDTKETIASVTLTNVPDGFLVFAGAGSGSPSRVQGRFY